MAQVSNLHVVESTPPHAITANEIWSVREWLAEQGYREAAVELDVRNAEEIAAKYTGAGFWTLFYRMAIPETGAA